jgi:hypothetical protein
MSDKPKPDLAIAAAERSLADRIEAEWYASPRPSPHPKLCNTETYENPDVPA